MKYLFDQSIDLTHELANGMPIYPGDPSPSFERYSTLEKNGVNLTRLVLGSHTGTHVDAPIHFIPGGISVDRIPPSKFVGEAYVADLSDLPIGSGISAGDLESKLDSIHADDIVLCYTGSSKHWGEEKVNKNYTYFTEGGAGYLVEKGVRGVGIDFLSVEQFGAHEPVAHKKFLGNGIFIIESLSETLSTLVGRRVFLMCLPIKLEGGDGAPTRAIAVPISQ